MTVANGTIITGHKVIVDPENPAEVCGVLGTNHADVGWVCSRSTLINKWAKYKPVSVANLINTTPFLNASATNKPWNTSGANKATWWQGGGTCGFTLNVPPIATSTSDNSKSASTLATEATQLASWFSGAWAYNAPTGTISSPYRLLDFHWYDHNAQCFISSISTPNEQRPYYGGEDTDDELTYTLTKHTPSSTGITGLVTELSWNDIASGNTAIGDMHFGLIFVKTSESTTNIPTNKKFIISPTVLFKNTGGNEIELDGDATKYLIDSGNIRATQEYDVYPVFTTTVISTLSVFGTYSTNIYAVPNARKSHLKLYPNGLDGFIQGNPYHYPTGDTVTFNGLYLSIVNFWQADVTFSVSDIHLTMKIYLYNPDTGVYTWERDVPAYGGSQGGIRMSYTQGGTLITGNVTIPGTGSTSEAWSYGQVGGSTVIYCEWPIQASYFDGINKYIKVEGYINYTKPTGVTGSATLLDFPPSGYAPYE